MRPVGGCPPVPRRNRRGTSILPPACFRIRSSRSISHMASGWSFMTATFAGSGHWLNGQLAMHRPQSVANRVHRVKHFVSSNRHRGRSLMISGCPDSALLGTVDGTLAAQRAELDEAEIGRRVMVPWAGRSAPRHADAVAELGSEDEVTASPLSQSRLLGQRDERDVVVDHRIERGFVAERLDVAG